MAKPLPMRPVNTPKDLAGQKNGELDAKLLKAIPGGKLHHLAADAWNAMVAAAKSAGIKLEPTSTADTYRVLSIQLNGFMKRYDNVKRLSKPRSYKGKLYWLKPGFAAMAVPGTSNHGWGLAVDVKGISQDKLEWLLQNADKYGFSWELQAEPWHIRYYMGDRVPAAVTAYLASAPKTEPAKAPAKKAPAKPVAKKPAAKNPVKNAKKAPTKNK